MSISDLLHGAITDRVLKVFFEVHREIGYGFTEPVYRPACRIALCAEGLRVAEEVPLPVWFRGEMVAAFRADFIVNEVVLVEIKATKTLDSAHEAQLLNYLKASRVEVGLLLNFGQRAEFKRRIFTAAQRAPAGAPHSPIG